MLTGRLLSGWNQRAAGEPSKEKGASSRMRGVGVCDEEDEEADGWGEGSDAGSLRRCEFVFLGR